MIWDSIHCLLPKLASNYYWPMWPPRKLDNAIWAHHNNGITMGYACNRSWDHGSIVQRNHPQINKHGSITTTGLWTDFLFFLPTRTGSNYSKPRWSIDLKAGLDLDSLFILTNKRIGGVLTKTSVISPFFAQQHGHISAGKSKLECWLVEGQFQFANVGKTIMV